MSKQNSGLVVIFSVFFMAAFWLQTHLTLRGDVAYLIYVAQLVLAGKKYGVEIFETNPPMILYLYFPVIALIKLTHLTLATALRVYVFSLALLSFCTAWYLLKKIATLALVPLLFALLFVYLYLPTDQLGQREHLFLLLVCPYFFAAALKLANKPLSRPFAFCIGLAAGLGFGIKPYFLFPLIFIESFFILHTRRLFGWLRIESLTILSVLVLYLASTFYLFPAYFSIELPLLNHWYFIGIAQSLIVILKNPPVIFCLLTLTISLLLRQRKFEFELNSVLILALAGCILTCLVTQTAWYYHLIPALGIACLLIAFVLAHFVHTWQTSLLVPSPRWLKYTFISLSILTLFSLPLFYTTSLLRYGIDKNHDPYILALKSYLTAQPGARTISCFSSFTTSDCFPLTSDIHADYASRYPFFWWLKGLLIRAPKEALTPRFKRDQQYLLSSVADDLKKYQTRYVIINNEFTDQMTGKDFNFINYFSQNNMSFQAEWRHYTRIISFGPYDVYERLPIPVNP